MSFGGEAVAVVKGGAHRGIGVVDVGAIGLRDDGERSRGRGGGVRGQRRRQSQRQELAKEDRRGLTGDWVNR